MNTAMSFDAVFNDSIDRAVEKRLHLNATIETAMVEQHGEQVGYKKAAQLLNRTPKTVRDWAAQGLLMDNGHGIATRSIARFLAMPKEEQRPPRKPRKLPPVDFERII